MKKKYIVELIIDTEEDNPNTVTDIIGINPSIVLIRGEFWIRPSDNKVIKERVNENNIWVYSRKVKYESNEKKLSDLIFETLNDFDDNSDKLKLILEKYPNNRLNCIAYYDDINPFFKIDRDLIKKINYYSLNLTFDIYCI